MIRRWLQTVQYWLLLRRLKRRRREVLIGVADLIKANEILKQRQTASEAYFICHRRNDISAAWYYHGQLEVMEWILDGAKYPGPGFSSQLPQTRSRNGDSGGNASASRSGHGAG